VLTVQCTLRTPPVQPAQLGQQSRSGCGPTSAACDPPCPAWRAGLAAHHDLAANTMPSVRTLAGGQALGPGRVLRQLTVEEVVLVSSRRLQAFIQFDRLSLLTNESWSATGQLAVEEVVLVRSRGLQ